MITAEDYQVVPLSASQDIVKVKSVNRSASGISRAKEILDPTGAYSNVSVFAEDGVLYREESTQKFTFTFNNRSDIQSTIDTNVEGKLKTPYARQFFYLKYGTKVVSTLTTTWNFNNDSINTNTGYSQVADPLVLGSFATLQI